MDTTGDTATTTPRLGRHTIDANRSSVSFVRSATFLDADRYRLITFVSGQVDATAVRATTRVDRTEFGVTAARGTAGRRLGLTLEIRCVRV
ncbi:hypothetical protein AQI95_38555 [Streptomyces yokosukanensis]|uniref:Lipid/polyisoprenoid-binding YceI-like domain-containing protein n=1 Tax=Streptomyces yokosukanensis TaxID=67386 RepID=A0A124HE52_9ACTN|nr:YceI family protein [Streptomyces yokosukanensis]KUM99621.1 hypothetical protein AQI95_38555 [Streptomyces yokosukanensis]